MKFEAGDVVRVTGDNFGSEHCLEPGTLGRVVHIREYDEEDGGDMYHISTKDDSGKLRERWVAEEDLEATRSEEEIRQEFLQLLTGNNVDT